MEEIKQQVELEESKTINNKTVRFSSAPWYSPGVEVFLGGLGGIGSYVAYFLARQEANLYLFDFDEIDETNMAGQMYSVDQIGKSKAEAIKENIEKFCGHSQVELMGKYESSSMTNKYVFSGFDNMEARKLMFEKWVMANQNSKDAIFIDGRLLAEQGQVYFVTSDRIAQYRETLFTDDESPVENCSYKATSHCGALIASLMVSGFNNFITNVKTDRNLRDFPFSVIYELPIFNFQIK